MIGISEIGYFIPQKRLDNLAKKYDGQPIDAAFIKNKVGMEKVAVKSLEEKTSDLCVKAYEDLRKKADFRPEDIGCLLVCTQNGDMQIPHTSAIVHHKLALNSQAAFFDISLGCSGYVYALSIMKSFMEENGIRQGLLFTADPYSVIIDPQDKNTDLLFGDAAACTLLTASPKYSLGKTAFFSETNNYSALMKECDKPLYMDGRRIFNFAMREAVKCVNETLEKNGLKEADLYIFHQASRYVVDGLRRKLHIPAERVPFLAGGYGNTVSSSIPLILEKYIGGANEGSIVLCGFGVGLSAAATVLFKR